MSDMRTLRYARQARFAPFGEAGQQHLANASVLVCGCGALGSVAANTLVRAGVGLVRIVDRDFLELNNLQRQVLYDEADVAAGLPKAIAAQNKLQSINSSVTIEAFVSDVNHNNIEQLLSGIQVIVDGTDNFETRFLLNDASLHFNIPWIYGGCIGAEGQTMTILPHETPCLRCLMQETPPPGTTPTCDSAGIMASIINVIASIQALEAIKILSHNTSSINRQLLVFDLWDNEMRQVKLDTLREYSECPACQGSDYPWLRGERGSQTAILCGRNSVQLLFPQTTPLSFPQLAEKLATLGNVTWNRFLLRFQIDAFTLTIFTEGRAIISGTESVAEAKSLYARYIGN